VWLLLTGASSSGKTEVLNSLVNIPKTHAAATLTEAALLSGTPQKERAEDATGGLLREVDQFGILVLKDFTSILSMHRGTRQSVLAALREIYDGHWTRRVGVDGARTLSWSGKLGLIGGVTSAIDSAHAVMSSMGNRFALFRLPEANGHEQAKRALAKTGCEEEMRTELAAVVAGLLKSVDASAAPSLPRENDRWIIALTTVVARCRSAVDRDGYSRDISLIHDPEAPARLTRMLGQLLRGALVIGIAAPRARALIVKVGLDCIPPVRRLALEALLKQSTALTTKTIAAGTHYPEQTVRRALEDLQCHGVVEQGAKHSIAELWHVAPHWKQQFEVAHGAFPKCQ